MIGSSLTHAKMPITCLMTAVAVAAMLLAPAVAQAAPIFNTGVEVQGASFCTTGAPNCKTGGDNSSPATSSVAVNSFPWTTSATATTGLGTISTRTASSSTGGAGGFAFSRATPFFLFDNLVLTKLPGSSALPDTATVGFDLTVDFQSNKVGFAGSNELRVRGGINRASDLLGAFNTSVNTTITRSRTITVGVPFFIQIGIDINSSVATFDPDSALATVALALDPFAIFNLMAGYTVSGASGLVVNNSFLQPPIAVPEPGSLALLCFGLVGLMFARRRTR